ncbi:MAG: hypothetical protein AAGA85_09525 [Bacteroidota bacterium]
MKVLHTSLISLLLLVSWVISAQEFENGAYHSVTGEPVEESVWMDAIMGEIDIFAPEKALPITLESNFRQFITRKNKDEYQEALLHFPIFDTVVVKRIVRIKPRGEFRKNYCATPPIRLNMKKTDLDKYTLQRLNKMKMVVSCKGGKTSEDLVLREYLVYKMYNVFTDLSFRARLLEVNFVDTGKKKNNEKMSYAFLIEEEKDVANRLGILPLKVEHLRYSHIDEENMLRFALFNYMVGNTDWSITKRHNMKLATTAEINSKGLVIPYDFDYSGVVGAGYAAPDPQFGIKNVRQRVLRCPCYSDELFSDAIDKFISKKDQLLQVIQDFDYLSSTSKKDVTSYINQFYKTIEAPSALKYLRNNCGAFL